MFLPSREKRKASKPATILPREELEETCDAIDVNAAIRML
jgi:hypothetical protein